MIPAVLGAYLVGAVPVGWLVARAFGMRDIRRHGSGNIGATNVLRTVGRLPAIVTLFGDVLKGYLAVMLAARLTEHDTVAMALASVAAVVGNCWSVFLGFRGGKGVATGLGVFISLAPLAVLCALPFFVIVVAATRYVSLGSVTSAAVLPVCVWLLGNRAGAGDRLAPVTATAVAGAALIIFMHRANIGRLLRGQESKLKL